MKYDRKKLSVGLLSLLVVLACAVSGTLAWISTTSGTVTNTFTPAKVTTEVDENTEGGVKSNVKITNTGDVDAYIRAAVVINLLDENGNVLGTPAEENTHYTITWNNTNWQKSGDYYYYSTKIIPGGSTGYLIDKCETVGETKLQVTIIAEGIQADGMDTSVTPSIPAVESAWKVVTVNADGTMTPNKNS